MGKTLTRDFLWRFDAPPEAIWPVLADTARFNEAAKLPKHDIDEQPREDGPLRNSCGGDFWSGDDVSAGLTAGQAGLTENTCLMSVIMSSWCCCS